MDYIASIGIGTGLDLSGFYAGLEQIKRVKLPIIHVVPTVDHTALYKLNEHIDEKVVHVARVNAHFKRNPIKVYTDIAELIKLKATVTDINNWMASNPIKVKAVVQKIDEAALRSQINELSSKLEASVKVKATVDKSETQKLNVALESGIKEAFKDSAVVLKNSIEKANSKKTSDRGLLSGVASTITAPIKEVVSGVFTSIGFPLGEKIGIGITKNLERKLNTSFIKVGEKIEDYSSTKVQRITQASLGTLGLTTEQIKNDAIAFAKAFDKATDPEPIEKAAKKAEALLVELLENIFVFKDVRKAKEAAKREAQNVAKAASELAQNEAIRPYVGAGLKVGAYPFKIRRSVKAQDLAMQAEKLAQNIEVAPASKVGDAPTITIAIAGKNNVQGAGSAVIAPEFQALMGKKTHVVPVANPYTDSGLAGLDDFLDELKKADKGLMGNLNKFLTNRNIDIGNLSKHLTGKTTFAQAIYEKDKSGSLLGLEQMAYTGAVKGYNPDALTAAAYAIAYQKAYPGKKINVVGHSAGGEVAAGVAEITAKAGVTVNAVGLGTPMTGLVYAGNVGNQQANYTSLMGKKDYVYTQMFEANKLDAADIKLLVEKGVEAEARKTLLQGIFNPALTPMTLIPGAGKSHALPMYLSNPRIQKEMQQRLTGALPDEIAKEFKDPETYKFIRDRGLKADIPIKAIQSLTGEEISTSDLKRSLRNVEKLSEDFRQNTGELRGVMKEDLENYLQFLSSIEAAIKDTIAQGEVSSEKIKSALDLGAQYYEPVQALQQQLTPTLNANIDRERAARAQKQAQEARAIAEAEALRKQNTTNLYRYPEVPRGAISLLQNQSASTRELIDSRRDIDELIKQIKVDAAQLTNVTQQDVDSYLDYLETLKQSINSFINGEPLEQLDKLIKTTEKTFAPVNLPANIQSPQTELTAILPVNQTSLKSTAQNATDEALQRNVKEVIKKSDILINQVIGAIGQPLIQEISRPDASLIDQIKQRTEALAQSSLTASDLSRGVPNISAAYADVVKDLLPGLSQEIEQAIASLPVNERLSSELGNQLANLKSQVVKIQKRTEESIKQINKPLTQAIDPGASVKSLGLQFTEKIKSARKLSTLDPIESQKLANEVLTGAKEAKKAIDDLMKSLGGNASQELKAIAKSARIRITVASSTAESLIQSQGIGSNIGQGLSEGMSQSIQQVEAAAEELAKSAINQAKDTLDIQSPSRVFQRIGEFVVEGFNQGIQKGQQGLDWARELITKPSQGAIDKVMQVREAINELIKANPLLRSLSSGIRGVGVALLALQLIPVLGNIANQAYQTAKAFDSLERSIRYSAGSESEGAKNIAYIRSEVERLNAPLQDATESFNDLSSALQGTKLQGNTREIFTALNEAALVRQLTPERRRRFVYGVVQAAGKPVLSSEEVNQQIGEAFPGAANIFARAYGESPETFRKNLVTGQYSGAESVLKFARQLRVEFASGVDEATNSTQALENRLSNTRIQLERMLGSAVMPLVNTGLKGLNVALEAVIANADKIALILGALALQQLPVVLGLILKIAQVALPALAGGFNVAAAAIAKFSLQTAALAVALKVVSDTWQSFQGSQNLDSAIEKNIKQFKRLEDAANGVGKGIPKTFNDLDKFLNRNAQQKALDTFNPIASILGNYNNLQSIIRSRSNLKDIQEFNNRVNVTLNNSQVKPDDAARSRQLSALTADPFLPSYQRDIYSKEKEQIDVRVRNQKELVDSLLEAANAEIESIDELWAKNQISRKQVDVLKSNIRQSIPALEAAQKELENFTSGQISLVKLIRDQLTKTVTAYADANTAITGNTARYQTGLSIAQRNGLTPGQAQYGQQLLQQRSLEAQVNNATQALGKLSQYVNTPDNVQLMFQRGINPETIGTEELNRLSGLATGAEEKLLYERLTKMREIEGQLGQLEVQLSQSQADAAQQLYELGKSVDEYLRGISRQTQELQLTIEASESQLAIAAEKNRLISKLQGFQSNFFSGFVDSLISGLDSIQSAQQAEIQKRQQLYQNQIQASDLLRQGTELTRQLPDGLPSNLVPDSISTTPISRIPIRLDIDAVNADATVKQLKAGLESAGVTTKNLNGAIANVNTSLQQTQLPHPDPNPWNQAIDFLKAKWNEFVEFVKQRFPGLSAAISKPFENGQLSFGSFSASIAGGIPGLIALFAGLIGTSKQFEDALKTGWQAFLNVVEQSKNFLLNIFTNPRTAWNDAIASLQASWQSFVTYVDQSIPAIRNINTEFKRINEVLRESIAAQIEIIKKQFESIPGIQSIRAELSRMNQDLGQTIASYLQIIEKQLQSIPGIQSIRAELARMNEALNQAIAAHIQIIEKQFGINDLTGKIKASTKEFATIVGVNLLKAFNPILGIVTEIGLKLSKYPNLVDAAKKQVASLGNEFNKLGSSVTSLGETLVGSFGKSIDAIKQKSKEAIASIKGDSANFEQYVQEGLLSADRGSAATPQKPKQRSATSSTSLILDSGGKKGSGNIVRGDGRVTINYRTNLIPGQDYGAPRSGGRRRHAGQDFDITGRQDAQSFLGGVVTNIGYDGSWKGYGHYVDIYNKALNVVERIAEASRLLVKKGDVVQPGQAVGRGESYTGVIHYEIRTKHTNGVGGLGFPGTTDPVKYLEKLGLIREEGTRLRVIGGLAPYEQQLKGQMRPTAVSTTTKRASSRTEDQGTISGGANAIGAAIANSLRSNGTAPTNRAIPRGLTAKGQRYAQLLNDPEIRALLDTIGRAEGATYDMLYGGSKLSNLSRHPDRVVRRPGWIPSSAAGKYQFMDYTWYGRRKQRPGPGVRDITGVPDFSPTSQDIAALALLDEAGILGRAEKGDINGMWRRLGQIWASFEGNPYGQGTPQGRRRSAIPYFQNRLNLYRQGGTGVKRSAVLGISMVNPEVVAEEAAKARQATQIVQPPKAPVAKPTPVPVSVVSTKPVPVVDMGLRQRVVSGQSQVIRNRESQDQLAIQQEQQALQDLQTRGAQEQRNRTEQTRQSLNQLVEQSLGIQREFRNLGSVIGDPTPLREFQQNLTATSDTYSDLRRRLLEFQRQTTAGVEQARATEKELTSPTYQAQPGQDVAKDIETTRRAIAVGSKTLKEVNTIIGQIDDQEKRRQAFEKERFAREEKLRRLAARDMITQEAIALKQEQLRRAQLAQQRNPRDFSQGDPIALQAEIELMQRLLPLDQKRRQLQEELRLERIKPQEYNDAIALLNQQEKALTANTEAARAFGQEERQLQFREADFAFLQRRNQASGQLTQAQQQAAELFQQFRPFDLSQGDPALLRYQQTVLQVEQERQQAILEQQRFQLTNQNRSQEDLNAILATINQAADQRLENARIELQQTQTRFTQDRLDFELRRKQQNQQADLATLQARTGLLSSVGIEVDSLSRQAQEFNASMQYDSAIRELEKARALTNLSAEDYERQRQSLEQILSLQRQQAAIAQQQARFNRNAEMLNLRADVLAGNGADFSATFIKRNVAIAQQNMTFKNQMEQLNQLKGQIPNDEFERMRDYLIQINQLKLDQIRQQFADLSREVELAGRDATKNFFKGFLIEGKGVFESLKDAFNQMKDQIIGRLIDIGVESIFKGKNTGQDTGGGLLGSIVGSVIGGGGNPLGLLTGILGFSEGGVVPGTDKGKDSVPAMLRPGEFVVSRDGVTNMGTAFLDSLNSGGAMPSYQQREYSSGEPVESSRSISIQYEKIGDREYVTREQFEQGIQYAAQEGARGGAKITSNWMRNSPNERRRHGL
jgi:muramidase (phage lysozyme)